MAIDKVFDGAVDGIADNLFNSVSNSVSEIKAMQQRKAAENVQLVVQALKKIDADIREKYDGVTSTIEQRVANIKDGRDGIDGKHGRDGINGKDGRDGKDGRNGRDGATGPRGFDGPKGADGKDGQDGEDGVSITDAHIDFDGSLIISLSSGRVINVGEVVAADIAEKIKVITNGGGTSQTVLDTLTSLQNQINAIISGLSYQGTWNASTNTPTLTSSVGTSNYYYIVSVSGSTNLNGITDWQVGDWAIFNGSVWQKIDQSNLVTSVAGRTGAVTLTTADIGGLGTIATQAANNVSITGGSITGITDLAVADGGTGASTASGARTNLGLGTMATQNASSVAITGGTINFTSIGVTTPDIGKFSGLTVVSTMTLTDQTALSALALDAGKNVISVTNTGSGNNVLANSPTLITPILGTPASGNFSTGSFTWPTFNQNTTGVASNVTGTVAISNGGTGQTTANAAFNALAPSQTGNSGKYLTTDGTDTSWATNPLGTVTSVAATVPTFLSVSGSPITSSGTLAITLSGTALPTTSGGTGLTSFTANGVAYASSTSALTTGSSLTFSSSTLTAPNMAISGVGNYLYFDTTGSTGSNFIQTVNNFDMRLYCGRGSSSYIDIGTGGQQFGIGGSEQMRLNSTGLGIGTSSPVEKVQSSKGISATGANQSVGSLNGFVADYSSGASRIFASRNGVASSTLELWTTDTGGQANKNAILDAAGNLGLGVTPSAWGGGYTAFQIQNVGRSLAATGAGAGDLTLAFNAVYDSADSRWEYAYTGDPATRYSTNSGKHIWFTAPSGTAGNAITFTQAMTLDASGDLGIGTTSPNISGWGKSLTVEGASNAAIEVTEGTVVTNLVSAAGAYGLVGTQTNHPLVIRTNGTERARFDTSGNLGIGTSSPASLLDVATTGVAVATIRSTSTTGSREAKLRLNVASTGGDDPAGQIEFTYGTGYTVAGSIQMSHTSQNMKFYIGTTERARIDSSGNLLVGTSSAASATKLDVVSSAGGVACIGAKVTGGATTQCFVAWNSATTGDNVFAQFYTEASATSRGSITYNRTGGVTAYNTTSDYRAKDIIGSVTDSGSVIDSVPVYIGKMKGATQERPMFIAHETPEYAHTGEKDAVDADGNPVYQQMDASALIPVMWAEIQSLRKRLADAGI